MSGDWHRSDPTEVQKWKDARKPQRPTVMASPAADGFLRLPDCIMDVIMPTLTAPEFKVFMYIYRRTCGWGKSGDAISLKQFCTGIVKRDGTRIDAGTGLSRSAVQAALRGLVSKGRIVITSQRSDAGDPDMNSYRVVL